MVSYIENSLDDVCKIYGPKHTAFLESYNPLDYSDVVNAKNICINYLKNHEYFNANVSAQLLINAGSDLGVKLLPLTQAAVLFGSGLEEFIPDIRSEIENFNKNFDGNGFTSEDLDVITDIYVMISNIVS